MVPPWAVDLPRLFHSPDDTSRKRCRLWCRVPLSIPPPAPRVRPRQDVGNPSNPNGGTGPPRPDGFGFMETGVLSTTARRVRQWRWGGGVQQGQEVPKTPMAWARPKALQPLTGGKMPCPCARVRPRASPGVRPSPGVPGGSPAAPTGGGGPSRVPLPRPSSHALVSFREATARARTARSGAGSACAPRGPLPSPALSGSPRRTVSADTALPCVAWSGAARGPNAARRHQPYGRGQQS